MTVDYWRAVLKKTPVAIVGLCAKVGYDAVETEFIEPTPRRRDSLARGGIGGLDRGNRATNPGCRRSCGGRQRSIAVDGTGIVALRRRCRDASPFDSGRRPRAGRDGRGTALSQSDQRHRHYLAHGPRSRRVAGRRLAADRIRTVRLFAASGRSGKRAALSARRTHRTAPASTHGNRSGHGGQQQFGRHVDRAERRGQRPRGDRLARAARRNRRLVPAARGDDGQRRQTGRGRNDQQDARPRL